MHSDGCDPYVSATPYQKNERLAQSMLSTNKRKKHCLFDEQFGVFIKRDSKEQV